MIKEPKPLLKWAGGKKQLLPELRRYIPENYGAYFEPFFGGGALFFSLKPNIAYINDINAPLMHTYRNVKNKTLQVIEALKVLHEDFVSKDELARKEMYYKIRDEFNRLDPIAILKSAYFIFLNKTCYNGMYRENLNGGFNIPYGRQKNPLINDENNILAVARLLNNTKILNGEYHAAVKVALKDDFVYFDPPYHPVNATSSFTTYSKSGFTCKGQERLKKVVDGLTKKGVKVMLSNSYTDFIAELYKDYRREVVLASRSINSQANGRGKIRELLILNY